MEIWDFLAKKVTQKPASQLHPDISAVLVRDLGLSVSNKFPGLSVKGVVKHVSEHAQSDRASNKLLQIVF